MKKTRSFNLTFLIVFILILSDNCKKDDSNSNTVKDINGNIYHTITIGTNTWMVENLKTTKYNDGSDILDGTHEEWRLLTTGAYCNYDSDENYVSTYGRLYNWYAVNTGKLAPKGWHIATDEEWSALTNYLGGESIAGGKLKETSTQHWYSPNAGATNESGFFALPGGERYIDDVFLHLGEYGFWWSSTEYSSEYALGRYLSYNYNYFGTNHVPYFLGFSVRCVKD